MAVDVLAEVLANDELNTAGDAIVLVEGLEVALEIEDSTILWLATLVWVGAWLWLGATCVFTGISLELRENSIAGVDEGAPLAEE